MLALALLSLASCPPLRDLATGSAAQKPAAGHPAKSGKPPKAKIPGQNVEIQISLPALDTSEDSGDGDVLLYGATIGDALVRISYQERVPFLADAERIDRGKKAKKMRTFSIGGIACTETSSDDKTFPLTWFEAFPSTPEYAFDIRVMVVGEDRGAFSAKDFSALVKSFKISGKEDRSTLRLPPGVYEFRDEAAKQGDQQLDWVVAQCEKRSNDFEPQFYLGALAAAKLKDELALKGYSRAAELLEQKTDRTAKECRALSRAWTELAASHLRRGESDQAVSFFERVVKLDCAEDPSDPQRFTAQAQYGMACGYAKSGRTESAIASLREAIRMWASLKSRARADKAFDTIRKTKEFEALVKK